MAEGSCAFAGAGTKNISRGKAEVNWHFQRASEGDGFPQKSARAFDENRAHGRAALDGSEGESILEPRQCGLACPGALGKDNDIAALAYDLPCFLDHAQRREAGNEGGLSCQNREQRVLPRIGPDYATRVGEFLKKQKRVENRGVVGADERTSPVCAVFEAFVFAANAAHVCESVEISRAVAAYFLPCL